MDLFQYHRDDPIWHFSPALFSATSAVLYRARKMMQFKIEIAAYLAARELSSRQITGYLVTEGQRSMRYTNYTYDDYVRSHDINPMYSEPEIDNPWHISGIGEWDELYGDVSA